MGRCLRPRAAALAYFFSIVITGTVTGVLLALVLLRFVSGSLLAAMGDACGGIFDVSHGFLATSNWNYLLATAAAAVFIPQLAFLIGGGTKLLRATHAEKKRRRETGISCPALPALVPNKKWASCVSVLAGEQGLEAQTVGLLKPRIVVSEGLSRTLDHKQLEAVLAHEEAHRAARDNFFLVVAKSVALTLFYLPGPRLAFNEMRAGLERAADIKAARNSGGRLAVADALARIAAASSTNLVSANRLRLSAAVTGNGGDLASRLEDLLDSREAPSRRWRGLTLFAVAIAAALAMFASSAFAVAGSDQHQAFICFTQHGQSVDSDGICDLDHPEHS